MMTSSHVDPGSRKTLMHVFRHGRAVANRDKRKMKLKNRGRQRTRTRTSTDWHREPLSLETRITDSYKSTQNVRRFFRAHIGDHFKFTVDFMVWMRRNHGKSLRAALRERAGRQEV